MLLLAGEYERSLDQQNRLAIPAKLRALLGRELTGLYITPGMEHCLALYRSEELEKELEQLADAANTLPLRICSRNQHTKDRTTVFARGHWRIFCDPSRNPSIVELLCKRRPEQ